jgi:hypothetical protein
LKIGGWLCPDRRPGHFGEEINLVPALFLLNLFINNSLCTVTQFSGVETEDKKKPITQLEFSQLKNVAVCTRNVLK